MASAEPVVIVHRFSIQLDSDELATLLDALDSYAAQHSGNARLRTRGLAADIRSDLREAPYIDAERMPWLQPLLVHEQEEAADG